MCVVSELGVADMGERCQFKDDDDCSVTFAYKESPAGKLEIYVKRDKGNLLIDIDRYRYRYRYR